mgnify:CR=1 FL=1
MSTNTAALKVERVNVSFGGLRALNDVYLEVAKNEVVGLIGPNGAGKTTLLNALCGLVNPDSGELHLNEKKHDFPKPYELVDLGIARTLQGVGLFGDLTVLENVMMGADSHNKSNFIRDILGFSPKFEKQLEDRAHEALAWAGAAHTAFLEPTELTYPDSKRVAIARALVMKPKLLLLDEPTASLDPETGDFVRTFLENYKKEKKISVLLALHNMDEVKRLCSSVLMMKGGDIIDSGTPDDLIKKHGRKNLEEVFLELVRSKNEFN